MKIQTTIVYKNTEQAYKEGKTIIVHQGGTRSSKTYNILIWLITHALNDWENEIIDIARDTFTALRNSAMFDFFQIIEKLGIYNPDLHNKTEHSYKIGTNLFRFFGTDDDQKVRGPGRSILFLNEMNEIKYSIYKQLNQRTTKLTIGDYNPSDEYHWIYDNILTDQDTAFFKTTFRDNPFLPERIKKEIKKYKEVDPNYWRIYGLGERGVAQSTIYNNWTYAVNRKGQEVKFEDFEGQIVYGMDFGYNDPTTIIRVKYHPVGGIYAEQLFYRTEQTSDSIILNLDRLRIANKITYEDEIIADSSRPEIIEAVRNAGYNIKPAKKEAGSVLRGINFIKKNKVFITKESTDLIKEIRSYKWKTDKDERILDKPVDLNDHTLDALRYALEKFSRNKKEIGIA